MPDLGVLLLPAAGIVITAAVYGIYRGVDVRLALLLAALHGDVAPILREFLATLSNERIVVPICTAMGFAYAVLILALAGRAALFRIGAGRKFNDKSDQSPGQCAACTRPDGTPRLAGPDRQADPGALCPGVVARR